MTHASVLDGHRLNQARSELLERGFGLIPGAVPELLLSELRHEADALIRRHGDSEHHSRDYWTFIDSATGQKVLYRIQNLQQQPSALHTAALFAAGPMHELAAHMLDGPASANVCAMIVKVAQHAAAVPWHRDRTNVPPGTTCNLSLFLDDSDAGNGCLQFVPGSHLLADDADAQTIQAQEPVVELPLRQGDVAVHDVRTVHASLPNRSLRIRRSIVIEFSRSDLDQP